MNIREVIGSKLQRGFLPIYRFSAIITLYGVLGCVATFAGMMGFYALDGNWIAPIILSPADKMSLDLVDRMVTSNKTRQDLSIELQRLEANLDEMTMHRAKLAKLEPRLNVAISKESKKNSLIAKALAQLGDVKVEDNSTTETLNQSLDKQRSLITANLQIHLITESEAIDMLAQINQSHNLLTDSKIAEVMLRDQIADRTSDNTRELDLIDKIAELQSQLAQLDISITTSEKAIAAKREQIQQFETAIEHAKATPFYLAVTTNSKVDFAFVPYDNQSGVKVSAPVYDCYLNFIACRKVGQIGAIYQEEEHIMHPIFKTDVRGFLVRLDLEDRKAATHKVVFFGHKPLGL